MMLTRPDISYAIRVVSRYMVKLKKAHWSIVGWIMRYLVSTVDYGLLHGNAAKE